MPSTGSAITLLSSEPSHQGAWLRMHSDGIEWPLDLTIREKAE